MSLRDPLVEYREAEYRDREAWQSQVSRLFKIASVALLLAMTVLNKKRFIHNEDEAFPSTNSGRVSAVPPQFIRET